MMIPQFYNGEDDQINSIGGNKIKMSNIRDLQKLRGTKNQSIFAHTNYVFTPTIDQRKSHLPSHLPSRSPQKASKDTEDTSRSPNKNATHRRGESFGFGEGKDSLLLHPRVSLYNVSMKLGDSRRKESPLEYLTERKERDNFFQVIERRKSQVGSPSKTAEVSRKMFNVLLAIGKGGFGKVWKVEGKRGGGVFAMKEMSKAKIIGKKSVTSVMNEKLFLSRLTHPFLVNMNCSFQDREHLYLIMDYLDGGDLRYHIGNRRCFNERETKFFIANILIGLQFLHKHKVIHRDIKPQNLVFDSQGYIRITDLGISREMKSENSCDTSGTPGYMAPEVMSRKDHSFTADYFAVGVIAYEFMLGRRPYVGRDRKQIREHMLSKQAQIRIDELPFKWSPNVLDFVNRLLLRNPQARLGANGIDEIMQHPWLADVEWDRMAQKKLKPPFKPISIEQDYESYKEQISEDTIVENEEETLLMLRDPNTQSLFDGYYFERKQEGSERLM